VSREVEVGHGRIEITAAEIANKLKDVKKIANSSVNLKELANTKCTISNLYSRNHRNRTQFHWNEAHITPVY